MEKLLDKKVLEVISVIVNSKDYKRCVMLREKTKTNKELMKLIDDLKVAQQEYVKYQKNEDTVYELTKKLEDIPIYVSYMNSLEKVNEMISYVSDDLNEYFNKLVN